MAPHLHPHHRQHKCSPPLLASECLGLYLVTARGERIPFCDVHTYGAIGNQDWHIVYSEPGKNARTGLDHRRSADDIAAYEKTGKSTLENDVGRGGRGLFMHSSKRKSFDIWLLGPLMFLGVSYGSLIVELSGYATRKIFTKSDSKSQKLIVWTEFPRESGADFSPCKLLQTGFHLQADSYYGQVDVEELKRARETARPAILKNHQHVQWKRLSANAAQTDCELYEQQEGLGPKA
jgi:hypothetical protein